MTPAPKIRKYGLRFDPSTSALEIEFQFIRAGGHIEIGGVKYGEGLFHHFKAAQTLLWPDEDHNRWSDLILKTILEERLTVIQGCRDSGKTQTLTKYVLTDYFCFPQNTLILMSSTDVRGLELRVWGNMKDLWQRARDRWGDEIYGNPIDSKHGIFTDALDPEIGDVRDMRKGVICFVTGTPVDTPSGPVPIETLKPGDEVLNACGVGVVKKCQAREADAILRVTLSDGRFVDCTPEHPFFTRRGWIKAVDLEKYDRVFSAHETMSLMQRATWTRIPESDILFAVLPYLQAPAAVQALPENVSTVAQEDGRIVLQYRLCFALGFGKREACNSSGQGVPEVWKENEASPSQPMVLLNQMPRSLLNGFLPKMRSDFSIASTFKNEAENALLRSILQAELEQFDDGEKSTEANQARDTAGGSFPGSQNQPQVLHGEEAEAKHSAPLHHGPSVSECETERGGGRRNPQHTEEKTSRRTPDYGVGQAWVESVTVLKPFRLAKFNWSGSGYTVHNLEVAGHPSYSVNGIVVHNCVPVLDSEGNETKALEKFVGVKQKRRRLVADEVQFLSPSYLNILSNLDKGDFKSIFTGNPLGQKALDKVAEPECGWDSHPEPTKTETWRNKFDGTTINLVGTDSPNYDANRPKDYPYLMNQDDVNRVEKRFGKNSVEYYSQIKGVRKSGLNARLVLTSEMCKQNGAYDDCIWSEEEITNILAIDAGYGGDACEAGFIQFGTDAQRRPVIKFHEPELIVINLNDPATPEDQIAMQAKRLCEIHKVPYTNVYFEAGMRATLAISLARLLSNEVNAVNAGGMATTRPVCDDLFVDDDTSGLSRKRLKRCDEHYSKFITEMYFSVRLLVECKQAREMPKSAVKEFGEREWQYARGDRYELESKEDFKKRCGYSPNKADMISIGVEGARRLGFQIGRMREVNQGEEQEEHWLEREAKSFRQLMKKKELTYG